MRTYVASFIVAGLFAGSLVAQPASDVAIAAAAPLVDQGLNVTEEAAFRKSLRVLLKDPNTDLVITVRRSSKPRAGCRRTGQVYWVYSKRGTICFTRRVSGRAWAFDVQVVSGRNPIRKQNAFALATLEAERRASTLVEDPERRNLIKKRAITYPYAYERIVAELDGPRSGDFMIVPLNTADRGGKGAHGHLGLPQSRATLIMSGRGARRSPLSARGERKLRIKHPDIAPTVAKALRVNPYAEDTGDPAILLNGKPSETALLRHQDGRVLNSLLEPVFNTFVVSIDGLRPEDVTPTQMPNLTALLEEPCEPGGTCATSYEQARASMVTETNGNHTAMLTGAYGEDSGIVANETFDRDAGAAIDLDQPALNFAETLIDRIEARKPWLTTALVMGKGKLRSLFDCTRDAEGNCGTSSQNPENREVRHSAADFVGGATTSPSDPDLDCPAEPGSGSDYSTNQCTMSAALRLLTTEDPDFTFVNLPEVDAMSHVFGAGSPQAQAAVVSADTELGRLVAQLKASNKWQHSTVIVTADHNFGDTLNLVTNRVVLADVFEGAGPSPFEVVTNNGSASVYLTDVKDPNAPLTDAQQATLAELRKRALATEGINEALYRRPNPADGGADFTISSVHPSWGLDTPRVGELLITAAEDYGLLVERESDDALIAGQHGHPTDRHIPFFVLSGGTYVADGSVSASGEPAEADDTTRLPEQAENVDIAPTVGWILGVGSPEQSGGRVLQEAFTKHPAQAQRDGDITEPIANRAAIFIFDQNNSITLHCLIEQATCGDPVPDAAKDPETVANLRSLASDGFFARFGTISAWPSVTMPNHNTVGSGVYPGHHGLVNNRFYLREEKTVEAPIDPQDPRNPLYVGTSRYLVPEIETLHEAVHRSYGDWTPADGATSDKAYTASVDEPSARGADYATLEPEQSFPPPSDYIATQNATEATQDTTQSCAEADPEGYGLESTLDHQGQTQARRLYEETARHPAPKYLINNFTLTDGAGHQDGPHTGCQIAAFRDSDRRLGRILSTMRDTGYLGETLIVVTGDHGSENQDLDKRGLPSDFSEKLNDAGVSHVMADWHVYLLTLDVSAAPRDVTPGRRGSVTFTVRDDDTDAPVEGATIVVRGVKEAGARATTDAEGKATLEFTPKGVVKVVVRAEGFNPRSIRLR